MSPKPKISVSTHSFGAERRYGRMTLKDSIAYAASLDVEGIEIVSSQTFPNYPHQGAYDLLEMRDTIESFGMKVACYSTYIDTWITSIHESTQQDRIKQSLKQIGEAHVIGAKVYRPALLPHFGYHRGEDEKQVTKKQWDTWAQDVKNIIMVTLPTLKKFGVKWGTEIHEPIPPKLMISLAKEVNDDYVGLIPDFSCWEFGHNTIESFKGCMPYVKHVHAKAHIFNKNGEEPNIPFDKLIPIIKKSGYSGYITAEFEGEESGIDSKTGVKALVELIRRYL